MSNAPGSIDPSHHYGSGKLSETERKMMSVLGSSTDDEDKGGAGAATAARSMPTEKGMTSERSLAQLPIELIDRILDHAIFDDIPSTSDAASTSGSELFHTSQRLTRAANLCLVCRQFDQFSRSKMYRKINLSTRKMRPFLHTIKTNDKLAAMVQDLTLDSKIWTDVDENVIADIFLAVRKYCVVLKVGANESPMLPYLFYGRPTTDELKMDSVGEMDRDCALQVLDVCWRDEVEVQHQRGEALQGDDGEEIQSESLRHLFQHRTTFDHPRRSRIHLHHLTIDLYTQIQLTQLFDGKGFFVQEILPNLTFIRIELPLVVLQFKCDNPGKLVQGWPRDDWSVNGRLVEEAIQDRQLQTKRTSVHLAKEKTSKGVTHDSEDYLMMPYCPSNQLKTLTLRFLLNIHRNDMTLFRLLIPQEALDRPEHSWSVRASITAQCLSSTMQKHLNQHLTGTPPPDLVAFPIAQYKKKTAEGYWKQKWISAHKDFVRSLPRRVHSNNPSTARNCEASNRDAQVDGNRDSVKVSLLLKWPNAVDAFFHYSAMTTTIR